MDDVCCAQEFEGVGVLDEAGRNDGETCEFDKLDCCWLGEYVIKELCTILSDGAGIAHDDDCGAH
jgi:hypothetical protein